MESTTRCPNCGGAMARKQGRRGEFMSCLRWPDCKGVLDLAARPAEKQESVPRTLTISPLLYLTGCAVQGLCANGDTERWGPEDIGATAVHVAQATVAELRKRMDVKK